MVAGNYWPSLVACLVFVGILFLLSALFLLVCVHWSPNPDENTFFLFVFLFSVFFSFLFLFLFCFSFFVFFLSFCLFFIKLLGLSWYSCSLCFHYQCILLAFIVFIGFYCHFIGFYCYACLYFECVHLQGRSQPHSPVWARVPLSSFFPQISNNFSYFSWNFTYFLPHFGPPGGQVAHLGRPWLRHCSFVTLKSNLTNRREINNWSKAMYSFFPGKILMNLFQQFMMDLSYFSSVY